MSLSQADAARLGGSDVAGLLGLSPFGVTPLKIYARVVNTLEGRHAPDKANAYQERGNLMERAVLDVYARRTGARLLPGPKLTHPRMPWVRASLDALAERDGVIIADAKTIAVSERHHFGQEGTDQVRQDILLQMVFYIGIGTMTGHVTRPVADVPVLGLNGADPVVFTIGFDPELFAMLEGAVERFWKDHVLPRRPPPVTDPLPDVDAIGALYPRHSGEQKHWEEWASDDQRTIQNYLKAKARLRRAEMRAAACEAELKLMLKDVGKVYGLPASTGAKSLTWKRNKDGTETDWKAVAGELSDLSDTVVRSIIEKHTTAKEGARPLRVTALKEEE